LLAFYLSNDFISRLDGLCLPLHGKFLDPGERMRLLAMFLVLGTAACHTPSPTPTVEEPQVTAAYVDETLGDLFYNWFKINIARHCGATLSGTTARDDCVKAMLVSAFDKNGQAGENCGRRNSELGWFGECVVYGSLARELLMTRSPETMNDFNWWDAKSSFGTILDTTIVSEVNAACSQSEVETLHVCRRRELAKSLGLPAETGDVCGSWKVDDWIVCILREYFSRELAEASARI
jgi:hypothetical protein